MRTELFDFDLPAELIAQHPVAPRDAARLLVVGERAYEDRLISDLPTELAPGDLVFFGDARNKPFHVGVVVSEPGAPLTMIHPASSRGVTETEVVSRSYWLKRLRFGRRVLTD